jgi:adenylate cyclase
LLDLARQISQYTLMRQTVPTVILALIIGIIAVGLTSFPILDNLENVTMNWRFNLRKKMSRVDANPKVVLIGVDDASIEQVGGWPINRAFYGQTLEVLGRQSPKVTSWDILFEERKSQDPRHPLQDDELAQQAGKLPFVVMAARREDVPEKATLLVKGSKMAIRAGYKKEPDGTESPVLTDAAEILKCGPIKRIQGDSSHILGSPHAVVPYHSFSSDKLASLQSEFQVEPGTYKNISLLANSRFGFVDCDPDADGIRRHVPMVVNIGGNLFPSLSLRSVMGYYDLSEDNVEVVCGKEVRLETREGIITIPIDSSGELLVNFRHGNDDFTNIAFAKFIQGISILDDASVSEEDKKPWKKIPEMMKGSIVVFAATAQGIDIGATPLNPNLALVNVHLNAINNILNRDFLRQVPLWSWGLGYLVLMVLCSLVLARSHLAFAFFLFLITTLVFIAASFSFFIYSSLIVPVAFPTFGFVALFSGVMVRRYLGERTDKLAVRKALGSYLSEKVLAEVLNNPNGVNLGGTKKEITVLFSDIRGFTRYCDERDPAEVVDVLNEYLEVMTEVIIKYDGTIDKYVGDAIMAFWGAPQDQPDHAQRAVCAAVEMRYALANFKSKRFGRDGASFECGIGLNTGEALVGNMGSHRFKNYTVIGSTVNLAARLEALTKRFTARILISEETRKQIHGDFTITDLGETSVSGFARRVRVYSVEAMQDIGSALDVARKLAQQATVPGEEDQAPLFAPAPIPEDDAPVAPPKPDTH